MKIIIIIIIIMIIIWTHKILLGLLNQEWMNEMGKACSMHEQGNRNA